MLEPPFCPDVSPEHFFLSTPLYACPLSIVYGDPVGVRDLYGACRVSWGTGRHYLEEDGAWQLLSAPDPLKKLPP